MKFFVHTLGCKINSYDSDEFTKNLISHGFQLETQVDRVDFIIINSCAVTSESVRKTRQYINKFRKISENAFIILTGCASILDEFKKNKSLNAIVDRNQLLKFILNKFGNQHPKELQNIKFTNRTRAFLKIEDGCDNFCSYCIIPFARGPVKSKALSDIESESQSLKAQKFKEIVLTGINLGKYGKDINQNLIDAINIVRKYFKRIRLSSLEPDVFNENLINQLSEFDEICPSFHLSLQSGSNNILKAMNRKYKIEDYLDIINSLREKIKNVTFTTDVIVGFPGESDNDFNETLNAISEAKFIKVNVFPFSPRPFTRAENLKQIPSLLKKERVKKAISYSEKISKEETFKFIGQKFNVLFEYKTHDNIYEGYTENYIRVKKDFNEDVCGQIKSVIFSPYFE